jgi:hypothetical protein
MSGTAELNTNIGKCLYWLNIHLSEHAQFCGLAAQRVFTDHTPSQNEAMDAMAYLIKSKQSLNEAIEATKSLQNVILDKP